MDEAAVEVIQEDDLLGRLLMADISEYRATKDDILTTQ